VTVRGIEHDGDGAIVVDLHQHVLLKSARFHLQTRLPRHANESFEHGLGLLRRRRAGEAGATALARVGIERELAHQKQGRFALHGADVESPLVVGEDTEIHGLAQKIARVFICVAAGNTDKEDEACSNASDGAFVDGNGCFGHSL